MVLVLCIGDLHIPHRAADLPPKFRELLKPGKIHSILCTGNVCSKAFLDYLRGVSLGDFHVVQGDFDDFNAPDHSIVQIADFTIGLCHGHQAIPWGNQESVSLLQRQLDVDILVTGHTHEYKTVRSGDRLQINPGSATGAYNSLTKSTAPSFVLMDLDGSKATVYVYQLVGGEVKVEKIEYIKPAPAAVPAAAAAAAAPAVTALAS